MRPIHWKLLPLGLLGFVALALAATGAVRAANQEPSNQEPSPASQEDSSGILKPVVAGAPALVEEAELPFVDLSKIRFDPLAFKGRELRLVLQFRELVPDWDPHLTRFGTTDWVAFSGWSDARFTWDAAVYEDDLPTLFVRRGGPLAEKVAAFSTHERFEARAIVREVFLDMPWIEITSIRPMAELVGEGTILHVGRARDFMRKGQWNLALQQFERAKAAPLPAHARAELDRQIIECQSARQVDSDE